FHVPRAVDAASGYSLESRYAHVIATLSSGKSSSQKSGIRQERLLVRVWCVRVCVVCVCVCVCVWKDAVSMPKGRTHWQLLAAQESISIRATTEPYGSWGDMTTRKADIWSSRTVCYSIVSGMFHYSNGSSPLAILIRVCCRALMPKDKQINKYFLSSGNKNLQRHHGIVENRSVKLSQSGTQDTKTFVDFSV
ncbi:hypothetical protein Tcan_01474, partial [Toxocara canis]